MAVALYDDHEQLQGFASVVRDFSDRHEADQRLHFTQKYASRTKRNIETIPSEPCEPW
jgi:hypothetical protein